MAQRKLSFVGVGDVVITGLSGAEPFARVQSLLEGRDVRFCSVEAPITTRTVPDAGKITVLRSPPEATGLVAAAGFNLVSIAHNHALDFGRQGLADTLDALRAANIATAGAGLNEREARAPGMVAIDGVRVGLLAYCSILGPGMVASADGPGVTPLRATTTYQPDFRRCMENPGMPPKVLTEAVGEDLEALDRDIRALGRAVDVVLVSFHWGLLGSHDVLEYQRAAAHAAIDAGAHLVLGHHAHAIQGIERYRDRLVFYGLSDFVFGKRASFFGDLSLLVHADLERGEVSQVRCIPHAIDERGNSHPLDGPGERRAIQLLSRVSAGLNVDLRLVDGVIYIN